MNSSTYKRSEVKSHQWDNVNYYVTSYKRNYKHKHNVVSNLTELKHDHVVWER